MTGVLTVIRQRVNGLGVSEPVIQTKGLDQIVVELPGVKEPERAIRLIGETALLEFVEAEWPPQNIMGLTQEQRDILIGKNANIQEFIEYDGKGQEVRRRSIILKKRVLTGNDLANAVPGTSNLGKPIVNIAFKTKGAAIFFESTRRNVGKPIAILLDGKIISAPNVNAPIAGGKAFIEGNFTIQEMRDLVFKLKAGSLPVPVEIISNKIVGPTLGKDSIEKSKKAGLIGLGIVMGYMILFYRGAGVVACCALVIYLLLVISILKGFDATLTLPGIAGIILTLGMAVDANVIIFERVKDEMELGEALGGAVNEGFSKGFVAILDSNVTTMIAAIVLFWLGTGTIKGFALTLSIGILMSMFSAVFVTKLLLDLIIRFGQVQPKLLFTTRQRSEG